MSREETSLWQIFRWPCLFCVLSMVGLISALVGDGVWDVLSWATLGGISVWLCGWCWWALRRPGHCVDGKCRQ